MSLDSELIEAAKQGNSTEVESLIARGANVNARDNFEGTSLHWAAIRGYSEIVEKLIEKEAEINIKNNHSETPLFLAVSSKKWDIVKFLVGKRADVNIQGSNGYSPLHKVAWDLEASFDIIELLVKNNADIEAKDNINQTPLHMAAYRGRLDVVKLLVEHEANIEAKDKDNKTPLDLAREKGHTDIVNFLSREENLNQELLTAAAQGDLDKVTNLIEQGAEVEAKDKDKDNKTPLHLAAEGGYKIVVDFLLSNGANIEAKDNKDGWTPLHYAVMKGHSEIVQLLLDRGANINSKAYNGREPIHAAVQFNQAHLVKFFLKKGVNINVKTNEGWTPLHYAAIHGWSDIAGILIDNGANVRAKNKGNKTPLDLADEYNNTEIIKLLVRKSAELDEVTPLHWAVKHRSLKIVNLFIEDDVNAKEENHGWTPLHFAAQENKKDIAELLIARNATVDARNYRGWTPLHEAASKGKLDVAKLFVKERANVNARNNKGWTPLHEAAKKGNSDIVDFLIKTNGTDIEAQSRNRKDTPLHVAAGEGKLEVVKLLVNNTADVNAKNKYGKKPLDIAKDKNHTDVINFLTPKTSRKRRDVSNEQEFSAASGSTRITSWINDYIAWIKDSASEFIGNIPFKSTTSLLTNNIQVDYGTSPKKQSTYESEDSTKTTISQIDFNGTIALLDVFVRRFTGEKYPSFQGASLSQLEVLGYALNITQAFEKAIEQAAKGSGISMHRLSIDFVEVQEEITKKVVGGRFDEISGVLNSYVEKSCSNVKGGKFSPKKFDRFITAFNNELPQIPYEKERSISLSRANYIENQSFSLKDKNPSNYLEGVSVQGNLTQVKGV
ncbi:ankyrin repeat domain-containing protein [Wolbachia endosymbiont (group A) of Limnophora tigrina]|uniref:ankyrin repeat domain-containing protein n=1 Tax=Wolbachia endosymbiont (group A) of Limnophora tigrina TaxID=3139318 RepID=UPI0035B54A68